MIISANGLALAAKVWGPDNGHPCLALHGWLDNAATFDALAPLLSGLRIVALDLPGHGLSQHRSKDGSYAMVDAVADVAWVVRDLGWTRFTLLGHSMGAAIACLYAGTFPHAVDRLVLLEGMGPLSEEAEEAPARLARALADDARHSKTRLFGSRADASQRVVEAAPMELTSALTLLERGLVEVEGGFTWRTDPRLRHTTRLRLTEAHVEAFLRAITAPTLLVRASEGWPVPPELRDKRAACLRSLTHATIAGRHHVHLDRADAVAALINPFLRQVDAG